MSDVSTEEASAVQGGSSRASTPHSRSSRRSGSRGSRKGISPYSSRATTPATSARSSKALGLSIEASEPFIPAEMETEWNQGTAGSSDKRFLLPGLLFLITLLCVVLFFCCTANNNIGAVFTAFYLYHCVYVLTLYLLPRDWGRSQQDPAAAVAMEEHQVQEAWRLNQKAVRGALLLPLASATCATYRLVYDHTVVNTFLVLFVLGYCLWLFSWAPAFLNKLAPPSAVPLPASSGVCISIQDALMAGSTVLSGWREKLNADRWSIECLRGRVVYIKALGWLCLVAVTTFLWIAAHHRHCGGLDQIQLCSFAAFFFELLGTGLPPPPKHLAQ
uniref:Transmembrane protein n=1 Tax=Eutreptiella gymnastica TaxID=73025 RepID=A0A7S1NBX5_9EUGL